MLSMRQMGAILTTVSVVFIAIDLLSRGAVDWRGDVPFFLIGIGYLYMDWLERRP